MRKPWKPAPHRRAEGLPSRLDAPWHGWAWLGLALAGFLLVLLAMA